MMKILNTCKQQRDSPPTLEREREREWREEGGNNNNFGLNCTQGDRAQVCGERKKNTFGKVSILNMCVS